MFGIGVCDTSEEPALLALRIGADLSRPLDVGFQSLSSSAKGTAAAKLEATSAAGIHVCESPADPGATLARAFG